MDEDGNVGQEQISRKNLSVRHKSSSLPSLTFHYSSRETVHTADAYDKIHPPARYQVRTILGSRVTESRVSTCLPFLSCQHLTSAFRDLSIESNGPNIQARSTPGNPRGSCKYILGMLQTIAQHISPKTVASQFSISTGTIALHQPSVRALPTCRPRQKKLTASCSPTD